MRLSDIVSYMDLSVYPQVALVLFLAVFGAVLWRISGKSKARQIEALGLIPLQDGADPAPVRNAPGTL